MAEPHNAYTVRSALIVPEDGQTPEIVERLLKQLNIETIDVRAGGQNAWQAALAGSYDLIVMGWRLSQISGLALFNRLRQLHQYQTVPILVTTQSLTSEEFNLLAEFPCSRLLNEPLTKTYFATHYQSALDEASWYKVHGAMIESLIDFAEKDASQALALLKGPLAKAPNPAPLALIMTRKLRENGFYAEAERVILDHLGKVPDGPAAVSEFGKLLHVMGRSKEAMSVLERVNTLSPKNVARLCLLGEIELTLANPNGALSRFARVLEIDLTNPVGKVGVQMIKDKTATEVVSVTRSLASMLNVAAIGCVKRKRQDEGIQGYSAALNLASARDVRSKLSFNMGMAYLRWDKLDKAIEWFRTALDLADGQYEKATRLSAFTEALRGKGGEAKVVDEGADAGVPDIEEEALFK